MKNDSVEVLHQAERQRFMALIEGYECVVDYQLSERNIDFTHTYVSSDLRGRGVAEKLVRAGLSWARQENYLIKASCSYVQKFL